MTHRALTLNAQRQGAETGAAPLVIAHGLFGSARNWGAVAKALGERGPVVAVDMRNHGESPWSAEHGYPAMAADLAAVVTEAGPPADLLGHSMGGKAAMVLALTRPDLLRRLMVADIAPVGYAHSQIEYVRAMQAVDLSLCRRRADADAQLAAFVPEPSLRAFFLQSLTFGEDGPRWRMNLDVLADQMPRIMDFPDQAGRFAGPTLFISGGRSDYVPPERWPRILELFPAARRVVLPGAGHWLHAEAQSAFVAEVRAFLDE